MTKGRKKIINNKNKKILPVLLSIVHEIVHKWEFAFQVFNLTFLAQFTSMRTYKTVFLKLPCCKYTTTYKKKELVKILTMASINVNIVI